MLRPCGNWRWGKTTMLRTKMMLFTLLALAILAGCFDEGKVTGPVPLAEPQGIALAPTGACCYPDGSCEVADSLLCTEGGGDYQGEGTPGKIRCQKSGQVLRCGQVVGPVQKDEGITRNDFETTRPMIFYQAFSDTVLGNRSTVFI